MIPALFGPMIVIPIDKYISLPCAPNFHKLLIWQDQISNLSRLPQGCFNSKVFVEISHIEETQICRQALTGGNRIHNF